MVARVDLFVDFISSLDFDSVPVDHWITRAEEKAKYYQRDCFSGWTVGRGGDISARLYDKTLEIHKSKKYWLHEPWRASGWDGEQKVWRMEFQIKREALKALGVRTVPELVAKRHNLWQYLCEDYLRLAQPSETDQTRSRWPNHRLWDSLGACFLMDGLNSGKLSRFSPTRPPSDEHLFLNGLGPLSSFMAREGITDIGEAIGEFFHQAEAFHRGKDAAGMRGYLYRKASLKGKRFNTIKNEFKDEELDALTRKSASRLPEGQGGQRWISAASIARRHCITSASSAEPSINTSAPCSVRFGWEPLSSSTELTWIAYWKNINPGTGGPWRKELIHGPNTIRHLSRPARLLVG